MAVVSCVQNRLYEPCFYSTELSTFSCKQVLGHSFDEREGLLVYDHPSSGATLKLFPCKDALFDFINFCRDQSADGGPARLICSDSGRVLPLLLRHLRRISLVTHFMKLDPRVADLAGILSADRSFQGLRLATRCREQQLGRACKALLGKELLGGSPAAAADTVAKAMWVAAEACSPDQELENNEALRQAFRKVDPVRDEDRGLGSCKGRFSYEGSDHKVPLK